MVTILLMAHTITILDFLLLFREQGTGNREQKEELRLKASKTLYF
jgi:hypothetical protein